MILFVNRNRGILFLRKAEEEEEDFVGVGVGDGGTRDTRWRGWDTWEDGVRPTWYLTYLEQTEILEIIKALVLGKIL